MSDHIVQLAEEQATQRRTLRRGVITVLSGQATAYAITFASLPALAVIYSPSDFAAIGIFGGIVAVLGAVVCLCYERVAPLAEDESQARASVALCIVLSTGWTVAVALLAPRAIDFFDPFFGLAWMREYTQLLAISLGTVGLQIAFQSLSIREQNYSALSASRVTLATVRLIIQVLVGLLVAGPFGLLWGVAVANVLAAGVSVWYCRQHLRGLLRVKLSEVTSVASRYAQFPQYAAAPEFVQRLTVHLPSLLLAAAYGYEVAGWYALTLRLFATPQTIMQQAVSKVFFGVGAAATNSVESIQSLFDYMLRKLWLYIGPCYLIGMVAAPILIPLCFSARWHAVGLYCSLLAPMYFVRLVVGTLRPTVDLLNLPRLHLVFSLVATGGLIIGILVPALASLPAWAAILSLSLCVTASQGYSLQLMRLALPKSALEAPLESKLAA